MATPVFSSELVRDLDPEEAITHQIWPRNINQLESVGFVQDFTEERGVENVPHIEAYTPRLTPVLGSNDLLFVDRNLRQLVLDNRNLLAGCGIYSKTGEPNIVPLEMGEHTFMFDALIDQLKNQDREQIQQILPILKTMRTCVPFIHSERGHEFCKIFPDYIERDNNQSLSFERTGDISEYANNKGHAMRALHRRGVRVSEGGMGNNPEQLIAIAKDLQSQGVNRFILKKCRSASGGGLIGIQDIITGDNIAEYLHQFSMDDFMTGVLIEKYLDNIIEKPGIVIHVAPGEKKGQPIIKLISATDQFVNSAGEHIGNMWPIRYWTSEMEQTMTEYALWLDEIGAYGVAGLDFALTEENGNIKAYAMDPNVRITGSMHGGMMAHKLTGSVIPENLAFITDNNLRVKQDCSLSTVYDLLEKNKLLYTLGRPEGIIVNNIATNIRGKIQVTLIVQVRTEDSNAQKREKIMALWEQSKDLFHQAAIYDTHHGESTQKLAIAEQKFWNPAASISPQTNYHSLERNSLEKESKMSPY